ncbi:hypothetical protein [Pseudoduganella violaceinigra]|uniref:hypothetical protein n=1 Tax=Pseudoduganella violaceinigra TaxID=246602 RepID=UPI00048679DC|nr:hypothetical protein [Pseudoduganella violaceinigra]
MSIQVDGATHQEMSTEAWAYSIMMTRLAAKFFLESVAACLISNGRIDNEDLTTLRNGLAEAAEMISLAAGVPQVDS